MTTGSAAGTSSRKSDTCDAAKEVPIFKQPTGKWSLTGFLITCRKQKVNRGVEVTDPDTWLDPLFAKSSKQTKKSSAGCRLHQELMTSGSGAIHLHCPWYLQNTVVVSFHNQHYLHSSTSQTDLAQKPKSLEAHILFPCPPDYPPSTPRSLSKKNPRWVEAQ